MLYSPRKSIIGSVMAICIGGDLDGQVIVRDGLNFFKASTINETFTSEYHYQLIIMGDDHYHFWLSFDLDFHDAVEVAEKLIRNPKS